MLHHLSHKKEKNHQHARFIFDFLSNLFIAKAEEEEEEQGNDQKYLVNIC